MVLPISWYMLSACAIILLALACALDQEQQSTQIQEGEIMLPISWYMLSACAIILLALACAWDKEQQSTQIQET
jgi:prolipoprotein diacylglyceryltransferase